MKPRPLGNYQKQLQTELIMEASAGMKAIKEAIKEAKPKDPYIVLTEVAIHLHEIIALAKRMETQEETS